VSLALCAHADARALSIAASLAVDDILPTRVDPVELVRRLQSLSSLVELIEERRLRDALFASYLPQKPRPYDPAAAVPEPPRVALLGGPAAHGVAILEALPPARISYLDDAVQLDALAHHEAVRLVIVTRPDQIAPALERIESGSGEPPMLVAAHVGPPLALELPPSVEYLPLPAPMPVARARLALALRMAALRAGLRRPPFGHAGGLLLDSLTGLFNQGAFLDYLRCTAHDRALIGLEIERLEELNASVGYAAGNRALARLGRNLAGCVRATDLAGHLGGGRFAVAVAAASRTQLERLRCRLEVTVAEGESWNVLAAAEAPPAHGAPAQRLARLFSDLGRLRRAA
jgi:GGDEF domain-containing protein